MTADGIKPDTEHLQAPAPEYAASLRSFLGMLSWYLGRKRPVESPALALFDPDLQTIISIDASDYGLGAVLTQLHPDSTERTDTN